MFHVLSSIKERAILKSVNVVNRNLATLVTVHDFVFSSLYYCKLLYKVGSLL